MAGNIEDLVLEHLKKIQGELAQSRERDAEILRIVSGLETTIARFGIARFGRDHAQLFVTQIEDRH